MPDDPFLIDLPQHSALSRAVAAAARPFLSFLLGLKEYRTLYERVRTTGQGRFEDRALSVMKIDAITHDLDVIPRKGAVIVVSNHPHGIVDGLALASIVARVRPDVRTVANHLLARVPEMSQSCFFVDPFGGPHAAARSAAGLRAAYAWLRRGGALIAFPAGEVAHLRRTDGTCQDSPWRDTVTRLAVTTRASVVPAFIAGANSAAFYAAGRIHPMLRTALLAREALKKTRSTISVRLAPAISPQALNGGDDAAATTDHLRATSDALRSRPSDPRRLAPIVPSIPAVDLEREIATLPRCARLIATDACEVFCTPVNLIPRVLGEIGRLREMTYRAVGEGTGREIDLDAFDDRYLHLFSWDRRAKRIIGAYRLGQTDRLGSGELYTRTLFRYDERLLQRLSPALELGRSFVHPDYQRNYNALLQLWKAIGRFVVRHPRYRILFGPVSISTRYSSRSHHLLMAFLGQNHRDAALAALVDAVCPPAPPCSAPTGVLPRSIEEADRLIARLEGDGKGMPVLLRQYLKLNARVLGFNVDPSFGDVLDALMMVDLTTVDRAVLNRYMGREGASTFLRHHDRAQAA